MEAECCVPPGFRFHPTEEELVGYYLTRKVASEKIDLGVINEVDLYRIEPWDLHDRCKLGYEEQNEWYFFSHKDKKYPSGTRTNRATAAGFWKATGRDKAVLSKGSVIGMRKTLVFYEGRAPNGRKSDWIMHEYRLQSGENGPPQEEGWVVCRAFKKPVPNPRPCFTSYNPSYSRYYNDRYGGHQPVLLSGVSRATRIVDSIPGASNLYDHQPFGHGEQFESKLHCGMLEIPRLDSPSMSTSLAANERFDGNVDAVAGREKNSQIVNDSAGQFVDWKVLDNLLSSQLSESTSCSKPNLPMIHLDYGTIDHSLEDQFLASFED